MDSTTPKADGTFKITGDWTAQAQSLKEKFSELTEEDLAFFPGQEVALLTRMEKRLSKSRIEVIRILRNDISEN